LAEDGSGTRWGQLVGLHALTMATLALADFPTAHRPQMALLLI
jgi:hypothetical protein